MLMGCRLDFTKADRMNMVCWNPQGRKIFASSQSPALPERKVVAFRAALVTMTFNEQVMLGIGWNLKEIGHAFQLALLAFLDRRAIQIEINSFHDEGFALLSSAHEAASASYSKRLAGRSYVIEASSCVGTYRFVVLSRIYL